MFLRAIAGRGLVAFFAAAALAPPVTAESAQRLHEPIADLDGRVWTESDLEGRWVLLDFWATWCTPCRAEVPHLKDLSRRFADHDLIVLGVSVDRKERRGVLRFLRRLGVDWPQFHDGRGFDGDLVRRYSVESVPASVLLDPSGRTVARNLRGQVLVTAVESLLGNGRESAGEARKEGKSPEIAGPGLLLVPPCSRSSKSNALIEKLSLGLLLPASVRCWRRRARMENLADCDVESSQRPLSSLAGKSPHADHTRRTEMLDASSEREIAQLHERFSLRGLDLVRCEIPPGLLEKKQRTVIEYEEAFEEGTWRSEP